MILRFILLLAWKISAQTDVARLFRVDGRRLVVDDELEVCSDEGEALEQCVERIVGDDALYNDDDDDDLSRRDEMPPKDVVCGTLEAIWRQSETPCADLLEVIQDKADDALDAFDACVPEIFDLASCAMVAYCGTDELVCEESRGDPASATPSSSGKKGTTKTSGDWWVPLVVVLGILALAAAGGLAWIKRRALLASFRDFHPPPASFEMLASLGPTEGASPPNYEPSTSITNALLA